MIAADVKRALDALADPERALFARRVLGVAPGNYGEGEVVLGIPVPAQRTVARKARDLPLEAILLGSPVHEHRLVALVVLLERYRRAGRDEAVLVDWLERHRLRMPRTMLRYAIERVDPERRAALMARG